MPVVAPVVAGKVAGAMAKAAGGLPVEPARSLVDVSFTEDKFAGIFYLLK